MNITKAMIPVAMLVISAQMSAQNSIYDRITEKLLSDNPSLMAQMSSEQAEVLELKGANTLESPEVEFERLWGPDGDNRWGLSVSQSFDWPGLYPMRKQQATHTGNAFASLALARRLEMSLSFRQSLINYVAAVKEAAMRKEICKGMRELLAKYEEAWEKGETTLLDLNKVKLEIARAHSSHLDAEMRVESLRNDILSQAQGQRREIASELQELTDFPIYKLSAKETYLEAVSSTPMAAYYAEMARATRLSSKIEGNQLPGFSVGYAHAFEDATHFNGFTISMSLPIWSKKNTRRSLAARAASIRSEEADQRLQMTTRVENDYSTAIFIQKQLELYAPIVENTNNIELLKKAFNGGEIDLLTYLQEVSYFLEARLEYLSLHQQYSLALASLDNILEMSRG